MTLSKALGGIGYPLSCIAYDSALDSWGPGAHIGTFRGHQVAMAAGVAALDFTEQTDLPTHARQLGELALAYLADAAEELSSIGDVRGRGLMIGIELVKDRDTKEPWPELAADIRRACYERGLVIELGGHFDNVARFLPPLVISRALLMCGLEIFADSLRESEKTLHSPTLLAA
jgi:diaminobutyrate-2-oxoglutarate transaminase